MGHMAGWHATGGIVWGRCRQAGTVRALREVLLLVLGVVGDASAAAVGVKEGGHEGLGLQRRRGGGAGGQHRG